MKLTAFLLICLLMTTVTSRLIVIVWCCPLGGIIIFSSQKISPPSLFSKSIRSESGAGEVVEKVYTLTASELSEIVSNPPNLNKPG